MPTIVALYRGKTVASARLIADSADPSLVAEVAARMLAKPSPADDPAVACLDDGRNEALRVIEREVRS
jgi:hypothetical protein